MRDPQFSSDDPFVATIPLRKSADAEAPEALLGDVEPASRRGFLTKAIGAFMLLCGLLLAVMPV